MRLAELCEPLFQYACLLSRSARRGGTHGLNQVRTELRAMFSEMAVKAGADPKLKPLYQRVELILMIFIDLTIKSSNLRFARDWRDLTIDKGEENGDERFFDLLDDTLRDHSPQATEVLGIFYTCLGLGFTGWYDGQPEHLRKRQREIAARLRVPTEIDHASRIVPEAYEHVDTSNLIETPGASLLGIGIALAGLMAVLFAVNFYLYRTSSRDLNQAVGAIVNGGTGPLPASALPAPGASPTSSPATSPAASSNALHP